MQKLLEIKTLLERCQQLVSGTWEKSTVRFRPLTLFLSCWHSATNWHCCSGRAFRMFLFVWISISLSCLWSSTRDPTNVWTSPRFKLISSKPESNQNQTLGKSNIVLCSSLETNPRWSWIKNLGYIQSLASTPSLPHKEDWPHCLAKYFLNIA